MYTVYSSDTFQACMCNVDTLYTLYRNDRYDAVRICIGETMLQKLADLRLFMVMTIFSACHPV